MNKINRYITALAACVASGALLSGCATNGAASIPSTTQANLNSNVLQLAVGTANIGEDGTVGLNVVTTLRQPNGLSAVLADQPTLSGPFTVPAYPGAYGGANVDSGTNHVSGSPQVPRNNVGLVDSTLGTFTGVFSYGFGPYNCDTTCTNLSAYYPGNPNGTTGNGFDYSIYDGSSLIAVGAPYGPSPTIPGAGADAGLVQPFYGNEPFDYIVGPPAVPFFNNGTFPSGFAGYPPGFTTFEMTPVAGQYSLNVLVPAQNAAQKTYSATANLNSTAALGTITVSATEDGAGGLNGTLSVPAGVTESGVFVVDVHFDPATGAAIPTFYTVGPLSGTGSVAWSLPDNLGPCHGSGCQNGSGATPSIQSGDSYFIAAAGYDYPALEAGPPGNTQQKPSIVGGNGQADVTLSSYLAGQYGGGGPIPAARAHHLTKARHVIH